MKANPVQHQVLFVDDDGDFLESVRDLFGAWSENSWQIHAASSADAARALFAAENPFPRWLTFAFEHGQIRLVVRPDGWLFAIALRPETDAAQNLDALAAEFLALNLK